MSGPLPEPPMSGPPPVPPESGPRPVPPDVASPMTGAATVQVPAWRPGEVPLAVLVDYDGTIAQTDVSDVLLAQFLPADRLAQAIEYEADGMGSRRLMAWEAGLFDAEPATMLATAAEQPHDPGFRPFVERALAAGIPVEVVSDGFGFFIEPALRALGVPPIPVVTASMTFGPGGPRIDFPNGNARCFVCGTCKRNRVLTHQAAGRAVAFIGDGATDRYAAGHADIVFAKHTLERICREAGWPYRSWTGFGELDAWLEATLAAFRADPSTLPAPRARALFCGAEVWGPDRFDPPGTA
jgi:2-hydroxy-3-keto-5-methylthiopentenyl-1-phosphate phosphatase